jgi:hypothetical protein
MNETGSLVTDFLFMLPRVPFSLFFEHLPQTLKAPAFYINVFTAHCLCFISSMLRHSIHISLSRFGINDSVGNDRYV